MPKLSSAEKEEQARLSEEIEHFTQQADDLLGEVVSKRKDYPHFIVKLEENRLREKFVRLLESPLLSVSSPAHIDVEELNRTIAMKVDQTKIHSEKVEDIRKENEKVGMPRLRVGSDYRMDEDSNFSSGLRSRSRSPHPIAGFTSKEEQERQDHELALRLQEEEVNRAHSPVVEATLRPEEIEAILGSPYSVPPEPNVLNLEDSDMETISVRSSSPPDSPPPPPLPSSPPPLFEGEVEMYDGELTLAPDWSEHHAVGDVALGPLWNERDSDADNDSGDTNASENDDSDDDGQSDDDVNESVNADGHDGDTDESVNADGHDADTDESANESEDGGDHIEEQSDDGGEEMDDSEDDDVAPAEAHNNDDYSDSSSSDSSDSDGDDNDHRSVTPEQFLIRAYADLNSIELALTDLETIIENNRRELLAEESHQDSEEEEEPDDTVIRSGDYGRCTICFEEMPYDPVGCIYCQQLVGCRRCVNRWYTAANRRGDSIDILGGHPPSNHKQCPLCRHEWPDQVEVTSIFLLRDD